MSKARTILILTTVVLVAAQLVGVVRLGQFDGP
jgi:hypothetical protein